MKTCDPYKPEWIWFFLLSHSSSEMNDNNQNNYIIQVKIIRSNANTACFGSIEIQKKTLVLVKYYNEQTLNTVC